jgi:hypothetical protein
MTDRAAGADAPQACPRCGTPFSPGQEYCLECGLRLGGERTFTRRLEASWRDRFGRYPGDWMWPALLGLVIAVAGATAAILIGASDDRGAGTIVATTSGTAHQPTTAPATATAAIPTVPSGTPTETAPTTPTTAPPATTAPGAPGALTAWPASRNGFTVVLESIPTSAGRAFAVARARAASRSGLSRVGVFDSAGFSSLHPGYFVVFSGIYSSRSQADQARITAASRGYAAAYAREIRH